MRYDLAFFMCCCKSFLGSDDDDNKNDDNYYNLLQVPKDASADEIKRAYKKQSLLMHPDKLAQRGLQVTAADQAKFTKMKEAYEVLSDPHKKETYDAIGSKGMKYIDEPFSIDPAELAHNFAKSSVVDRSKIFAIFVTIAVAVLLQPILICMHVDGAFGPEASWLATLMPLWFWDIFLIFYHTRVIMMGPIPKPDHIPDNEWIDPLPMNKRIFSMVRFCLIVLFEVLVAFKLDGVITAPWFVVFTPLYIWEITTMYKKLPLARMRIVTVEDLESALGKPFSEFTPAEKELIGQRYSVVSSTSSPDYDAATKLKTRARHDIMKSIFRIVFVVVLLIQLDADRQWNWYAVFLPFWIMIAAICYSNYTSYMDLQRMAAEKDPTLFGTIPTQSSPSAATAGNEINTTVDVEAANKPTSTTTNENGVSATPGSTPSPTPVSPLTDEEREELKAQVLASNSRLCSKCCSQGFMLIIFLLFVAKLQGAGFSSFLIISPFLFIAGVILCCLGCAIFGVTEVSTDGIDFENSDFAYTNAEQWTSSSTNKHNNNVNSNGTSASQQSSTNNTYSTASPVTSIPASYVPPPSSGVTSTSTISQQQQPAKVVIPSKTTDTETKDDQQHVNASTVEVRTSPVTSACISAAGNVGSVEDTHRSQQKQDADGIQTLGTHDLD